MGDTFSFKFDISLSIFCGFMKQNGRDRDGYSIEHVLNWRDRDGYSIEHVLNWRDRDGYSIEHVF